jgi:hypothetical protein
LKKWNIVIAEESVRAYKLEDNSYLTDFEKNGFIYIFQNINTKTTVKLVKKSDYSKYFKRKSFIPLVVLQVELSENRSYINDSYFILAENFNSYDKKLEKINEKLRIDLEKDIENTKLKTEIKSNMNKLITGINNFNIESIEISSLENLNLFILNSLKCIENKDFKYTSSIEKIDRTIEGMQNKKQNKIIELKKQIDLILENNNKIKITELCEELKINRKTFYNLNLNIYLKEVCKN